MIGAGLRKRRTESVRKSTMPESLHSCLHHAFCGQGVVDFRLVEPAHGHEHLNTRPADIGRQRVQPLEGEPTESGRLSPDSIPVPRRDVQLAREVSDSMPPLMRPLHDSVTKVLGSPAALGPALNGPRSWSYFQNGFLEAQRRPLRLV